MNGKRAKELRKSAKLIYDAPTGYDDILYKVDRDDPEMEHMLFMDGALAKRTMKVGCTRKMYKDLKAGMRAGTSYFEHTPSRGFFKARKFRKQGR